MICFCPLVLWFEDGKPVGLAGGLGCGAIGEGLQPVLR